ncbi:MAG: retron system putative HNH endonuclease [Sulfuricellaceae bacterium]
MHKLDRSAVAAPACLAEYDYQTQTWDDFSGVCKRQVRFALFQIQGIPGITSKDAAEYGLRCAYCEGAIRHEGHLEHFRQKNRNCPEGYPELTFDWHNLFIACGSKDHCGHYKDRLSAQPYDPDQLIKPDEHDPEHYFYFHSSGEIRALHGLDDEDKLRAIETIRVFGLDNRSLVGARAKAVSKYRAPDLADFN